MDNISELLNKFLESFDNNDTKNSDVYLKKLEELLDLE